MALVRGTCSLHVEIKCWRNYKKRIFPAGKNHLCLQDRPNKRSVTVLGSIHMLMRWNCRKYSTLSQLESWRRNHIHIAVPLCSLECSRGTKKQLSPSCWCKLTIQFGSWTEPDTAMANHLEHVLIPEVTNNERLDFKHLDEFISLNFFKLSSFNLHNIHVNLEITLYFPKKEKEKRYLLVFLRSFACGSLSCRQVWFEPVVFRLFFLLL